MFHRYTLGVLTLDANKEDRVGLSAAFCSCNENLAGATTGLSGFFSFVLCGMSVNGSKRIVVTSCGGILLERMGMESEKQKIKSSAYLRPSKIRRVID